jgi:signal transduction histidine kinase
MAMHSSQDIAETVDILFHELTKLHVETLRCGISIIHDTKEMDVWTANPDADGKSSLTIGTLPMSIYPSLEELFDAWKNKESHFVYDLSGDDLINYFTAINNAPDYPIRYDISKLPPRQVINCFLFSEGALFAFTTELLTGEAIAIFKRFATLFGQTYRRYLDLQKAEILAKEATIEAALEKVRGKAMAMHNSSDLSTTASTVFTELRKLGISPIRCGVGLLTKESRKAQLYSATSSSSGDSLSLVGWAQLENHPVLEQIYDTWLQQKDYFPELQSEQLRSYYKLLLAGISVPVPDFSNEQKQFGCFISFSIGCLYAWSDVKYTEDELKILRRFATIIELTFRRYLELQQLEANAKEAVKQAALDRIRADIASMRTLGDLNRIIPLIWNELTILGLPFIRCGVFLMDDSQKLIHTFLSTPEGKAIAAFHIPYDTPGKIRLIPENWKNKTRYIDHWNDSDFIEFANTLVKQHVIESSDQYLSSIPHGGFYLHFVPFLQGMMYVGNTLQLSEDDLTLIQSVSDAFSTAYARYEDFNKLEAAKKQVDSTLNDLQTTQKQLIQSEKMASLGELTAGIAHEIQNPLNFVNNFSDVSTELLQEMKQELATGNLQQATELADDVIQNLEKILLHGKRADGIVKSMLQHSRASSGKKEPTDINALCDEYLRLSFHGLRAKDKTFNAKFETDLDPTIGKINIVGQDIGRVILNLINNAFYAVSEKKKKSDASYEPTVTVTTKNLGNNIEVRVKDNGAGMPQKILDKIFQPFFTTKPTGQGTGLGLSLSYDIITKGHGGELKVETKEGEGTEFIIQLPV